jgi:hypothetical protein
MSSDRPYFIGGYFFPQQIVQAFWLREFFRPASQVENIQLDFAPFYALGNAMIGTWPFFVSARERRGNLLLIAFRANLRILMEYSVSSLLQLRGDYMLSCWHIGNSEKLKTADWFVIVNTLQSLYWVYFRRAMNPTT